MSTISSATAEAYRLLNQDLYGHLDEAEFLAMKYEPWSERDSAAARKLIPDLILTIRAVLFEHQWNSYGNCRICFRVWPCPSVRSVHRVLKDPDREFVR